MVDTFTVGQRAHWMTFHHGRNPRMVYDRNVRILEIRKHTARIEARRRDGAIKYRFVKLNRLIPARY